ncbi:MAG: DUF3794 domain-containing protein [Lachnospiraceae bacterium]|nr:DUF3794 domain-containing protein [Lachnospiraceae bacterium]
MEGVHPGDTIKTDWDLEDLQIGLINSRKFSIQACIMLKLQVEVLYDVETILDVLGEESIETHKSSLDIAEIAIYKKDIFRLREETELPKKLPNMDEVLWQQVQLLDLDCKPIEEKIAIQGELQIFLLYLSAGEVPSYETFETTLPFNGILECQGCSEKLVPCITVTTSHKEIEIRPDADGEERVISVEMVLELDMKLYREEKLSYLSDVYGVTQTVTARTEPVIFEKLVYTGTEKCKVTDRIRIENGEPKIQEILHADGNIHITENRQTENGLEWAGNLDVHIFYQSNTKEGYAGMHGVIPFQMAVEIPGDTIEVTCQMNCILQQLSVSMLDQEEVEVKAVLGFQEIAFGKQTRNRIADIAITELDYKTMSELPGIVVYMVQDGDSLWDIGKRYYVPVTAIMEMNDMGNEQIKKGDKILIVK